MKMSPPLLLSMHTIHASRSAIPPLRSALPGSPRPTPHLIPLALMAFCLALGGPVSAAELQVRLLETTDLHMNLLSYDYYQDKATDQYGLSRAATLIRAARAEMPNSLLIDNGDLLQGNPMGDFVAKVKPLKDGEVHPAYKVMNQLGYDVGNLGNHEFNFGLPFLRRAIAGANFPYVNANVFLDDKKPAGSQNQNETHAFTPYVMLERQWQDKQGAKHTLKTAVIGLVPPQIMTWDKANLEGRVVARDMVAVAQKYVQEARAKGAHLVVLVPHSGFERSASGPMAENGVAETKTNEKNWKLNKKRGEALMQ